MNLEQALLVIANAHGNELPVEAIKALKTNWSILSANYVAYSHLFSCQQGKTRN